MQQKIQINLLKLLKLINTRKNSVDNYYINILKNKIDGLDIITNKQYKLTRKNLLYYNLFTS